MKYFFIVNPNAGGGKGLKTWNKVRPILNDRGIEYKLSFTDKRGDALNKALLISDSEDNNYTIMVIGGDGTLNEVVNGLKDLRKASIAYIPAGTGNDFARSLKLNVDTKRLISTYLRDSRIENIDYGILTADNGRLIKRFINSAGIGYDAAVCHRNIVDNERNRNNRHIKGEYSFNGLKELISSRPSKGYILMDDGRKVEFNNAFFVSIHIHPFEGGGYKFARLADPKDGMLELCVVSCKNKLKFASTLIKGKLGGINNHQGARTFQCKEAHVHLDNPALIHADGEVFSAETDIDVRCIQQQIRIFR